MRRRAFMALAGAVFAFPLPAGAQPVAVAPRLGGDAVASLFSGFEARSNDPVQVDAQSLEVFEQGKERVSLFTGSVVVKRGSTTIKANSIKLHQDLDGKPGAFTTIEASGGVVVQSGNQRLTGTSAVVDMNRNSIVVSGGIVLSQGGNVLTGGRLIVDLAAKRARIEGGVARAVLTPK